MSTTVDQKEYSFQAEIKQLLHLLSHSLYQNREIAIRELISNASDALDKFRHVALTDSSVRDEEPLEISVEPDKDDRILTIRDNGIGMTHAELVANLGTIAHSGSLDFLKQMSSAAEKGDVSLIGQFGVGFYSSFMLADRVEVVTRSCTEQTGWRWESDGTGVFTIVPAQDVPRGTQVRLHLKSDLDEFTRAERLRYILTRYSTFVPYPIKLEGKHVNDQPPIWVEPKSQLSEEKYNSFYQFLSHRGDEKPLWHLHLSSDSPFQFHAILYCPPTNYELLGFGRTEHGLHLCAKRVLVQNDCRELLPEYLRFIYGLVDSADLPLNVSREALQDNTVFRKIRTVLVKRVLGHLEQFAQDTPAEYLSFFRQFGPILKEDVHGDFENRERIARLLRFPSSRCDNPDEPTSLDAYIERSGEKQRQIYYLGGPEVAVLKKNPNLEIFRQKNLEVLFITDPIDEFLLAQLHTFAERRLISIDAAEVEFPEGEGEAEVGDEKAAQPQPEAEVSSGFNRVLDLFRDALGELVQEVRQSKRLTDSPCCLVNPAGGASAQLQRVLSMTHKDFEMSKRILEVNANAPFIQRLSLLAANEQHDGFIRDCGRQLYANALMLEGLAPNVDELVTRTQRFMQQLADSKTTIIT